MAENKYRQVIAVLVFVTMWAPALSCVRLPRLFIYNNCAQEMIVSSHLSSGEWRQVIIPPHRQKRIVGIDWQIKRNGVIYRYDPAGLPAPGKASEYLRPGFISERISLQYDADNFMYIIGNKDEIPLKNTADQPHGFPLKPMPVK